MPRKSNDSLFPLARENHILAHRSRHEAAKVEYWRYLVPEQQLASAKESSTGDRADATLKLGVRFAGKLHRKMLRNAMSMKLVDSLEAPNLCDLNADPRKAGLRGASSAPP